VQNNELRSLNTRSETLREIRTLVVSLRETPL
jgi:3-polyprenyl-4-hydroxybenzoate decarboxylase